jgi:hypothetical protein
MLSSRCRFDLDVTRSKFLDRFPRNIDFMIQKMEFFFVIVGGNISLL